VSREVSQFYRERFQEFRSDLTVSWAIRQETLTPLDVTLRTIHRRYLGVACVATLVAQNSPRNDYVRALPEVTFLAAVLAIKGLENPGSVLLRQSIELVLKHIYFASHPVEFQWSLNRLGYREISFQFLLDYIRKTDESNVFPQMNGLLDRVDRLFHEFSRFVHVHSRRFIPYRTFQSVTTANSSCVAMLGTRTRELWPLLISLLIIYFPTRFTHANLSERRIISSSLGTVWGKHIKRYLHALATR
jgi:hypothetical protein